MQILDLIFIKMLALYGVYKLIRTYIKYFRTNKKTSNRLMETYVQVELEKRLRRRNETN